MDDAYHAYCASVLALRGHALARVIYVTGSVAEADWTWMNPTFDVLDQGLELETTTGAQFAIPWHNTFACYGLAVIPGSFTPLLVPDADVGRWDVSASARWQPVLHTPIDDIHIYWLWSWDRPLNGAHVKVPYSFALEFHTGQRIYLVAAAYVAHRDDLFPMTDDVVVIGDEDVAQKYGIGPYGGGDLLECPRDGCFAVVCGTMREPTTAYMAVRPVRRISAEFRSWGEGPVSAYGRIRPRDQCTGEKL